MAVQMSSPALRAENVATPSPKACNRPKTTKVTTSANCNDGTKQTGLRNQTARKTPSTNNLAPNGDLGWMVQRRIPMHNNGIVHREWPRMQYNGVAHHMQHNGVALAAPGARSPIRRRKPLAPSPANNLTQTQNNFAIPPLALGAHRHGARGAKNQPRAWQCRRNWRCAHKRRKPINVTLCETAALPASSTHSATTSLESKSNSAAKSFVVASHWASKNLRMATGMDATMVSANPRWRPTGRAKTCEWQLAWTQPRSPPIRAHPPGC